MKAWPPRSTSLPPSSPSNECLQAPARDFRNLRAEHWSHHTLCRLRTTILGASPLASLTPKFRFQSCSLPRAAPPIACSPLPRGPSCLARFSSTWNEGLAANSQEQGRPVKERRGEADCSLTPSCSRGGRATRPRSGGRRSLGQVEAELFQRALDVTDRVDRHAGVERRRGRLRGHQTCL
jgi:hypothetical protein